jgi:alpha/beta superfamily hydrolase
MMLDFEGPVGRIEALLDEPVAASGKANPRAIAVLGHPHTAHGGTMHTKVVYQAAKALARIGCAVLRFNFRGAGGSAGNFDAGPGEMDDFRAALDFMIARYPAAHEVWAGGFSFGAWIGLAVGAEDARVTALIGIAPPVGSYNFSAVRHSGKPKFFIQGEIDELFPLSDLRRFYAELPEPKELVVIDAADHLFDGKASEIGDAIEDLLQDFPVKN